MNDEIWYLKFGILEVDKILILQSPPGFAKAVSHRDGFL
jgi:hypothetical protein